MCRYVFDFIFFDKNTLIEKRCPIVWAIDNIPEFDEGCLLPVLLLQGVHVSPASVQTGQFLCCDGLWTCKHGTWNKKDLLDKGQHQVSRKSNPDPILSFLFIKNGTLYVSII